MRYEHSLEGHALPTVHIRIESGLITIAGYVVFCATRVVQRLWPDPFYYDSEMG